MSIIPAHSVPAKARFPLAYTFVGLALLLITASAFFSLVTPQLPSRMMRSSADLIDDIRLWQQVDNLPLPFLTNRQQAGMLILAATVLAFAAYALAIYLSRRHGATMGLYRIVVVGSLALFAISLLALPTANSDIYIHLMQGRIVTEYGQNPHYVVPDQFRNDPMYPYTTRQYSGIVSDYFPVWTWVTVLSTALAPNDPARELLMHRLMLTAFNIANLALIAAIMRRLKPERELAAIVIYGWNPIISFYGQSKPDAVMAFFLLLAVVSLLARRPAVMPVFMTLSLLVKLTTAPLLAAFELHLLRKRQWRTAAVGLLLAAITALLVYAPFLDGPQMFAHQLALFGRAGSTLPDVFQLPSLVGFVALIVWVGLSRDGTVQNWIVGWTWLMFYFSVFMIRPAVAWYLITLITLAALSDDRRFVWLTTALSSATFLVAIWDNNSNAAFRLPTLPGERFFFYIGIAAFVAIFFATVLGGRRLLVRAGR